MKVNSETWKAAAKAAMTGKSTPSAGVWTQVASIRVIRDALVDELSKDAKVKVKDGDKEKEVVQKALPPEAVTRIRTAFSELIGQITNPSEGIEGGFACNASAAAKFAGMSRTTTNEFAQLTD